jgi:hypothetical protein
MIIQIESTTVENTEKARQHLATLSHSWGQELAEVPADTSKASGVVRDDGKVIDPISLTALVLSIPSAALAVLDLADRIQKRRRAKDLIDQAQQLADQQNVTVSLVSQNRPVELTTLTADQLLDLLAEETQTR